VGIRKTSRQGARNIKEPAHTTTNDNRGATVATRSFLLITAVKRRYRKAPIRFPKPDSRDSKRSRWRRSDACAAARARRGAAPVRSACRTGMSMPWTRLGTPRKPTDSGLNRTFRFHRLEPNSAAIHLITKESGNEIGGSFNTEMRSWEARPRGPSWANQSRRWRRTSAFCGVRNAKRRARGIRYTTAPTNSASGPKLPGRPKPPRSENVRDLPTGRRFRIRPALVKWYGGSNRKYGCPDGAR